VERFEAALQKVREGMRLKQAADLAGRLSALLAAERAERRKRGVDFLVVPTIAGDLVIPVAEIDWIGAEDYYARLHVGAKSYLLRESLSSLETRLDPSQFVRLHRAALVQVNRIGEIRTTTRGGEEAILRDGSRIPVGRRRRAELDRLLRRV
jgi:DNA-binding LytR/AlgR family response regulator